MSSSIHNDAEGASDTRAVRPPPAEVWSVLLFHPVSATLVDHDVTCFLAVALDALIAHVRESSDRTSGLEIQATVMEGDLAQIVIRAGRQPLVEVQRYWLEHDVDDSTSEVRRIAAMDVESLLESVRDLIE